jgi:hypothetical protein
MTCGKKPRKRPGTKPKILDEIKMKQLAGINATIEDIARQLGVSRDTLERRYRPIIDKARAEFRSRILLAQIRAAEKGNPAMLIWLGKQYLGQVDSSKIDHTVHQELPEDAATLTAELIRLLQEDKERATGHPNPIPDPGAERSAPDSPDMGPDIQGGVPVVPASDP